MSSREALEDVGFVIDSIGDWSLLDHATVLVSGASGFLATYMVDIMMELRLRGICPGLSVVGLVRRLDDAWKRFSAYAGCDWFRLLSHDVNNPLEYTGPVDYVIHAAGQPRPIYYGADPVGTLSASVFGTHNLLDFGRRKGVKGFLFFSSGEVYGVVDEDLQPIVEDCYGSVDQMSLRSCYAEGKRMGENLCVAWSAQYGVPVKIVRLFQIYGPGVNLEDGRVFTEFVKSAVYGRDIPVFGDGSALRTFCYVADAMEGFFRVLLAGEDREVYNIGYDDGEMSILDLAILTAKLSPTRGLGIHKSYVPTNTMKNPIHRACPDTSKIRALGWKPKYSVEEGFRRTISSFLLRKGGV